MVVFTIVRVRSRQGGGVGDPRRGVDGSDWLGLGQRAHINRIAPNAIRDKYVIWLDDPCVCVSLTTRDGEVASRRRVPAFGNSKTNRTGGRRKQRGGSNSG